MKKLCPLLVCMLLLVSARATHLEGGELFYDYTGNGTSNTYHITLKLYRNCFCVGCAPFANPEYVTVFDATGNVYTQVALPRPDTANLQPGFINPCMGALPEVCVTEADYTGDVVLPPTAGGYDIVYQRCCRDGGLVNLLADQGATYTAHVPGSSLAAGNSSARFLVHPPLFVCLNQNLALSYAASDPDGDSLVYSLCSPFLGADGNCPDPSPNSAGVGCPTSPNAPPYASAGYTLPYDSANFTNNPSTANDLSIDPHTGILTGVPNTLGLFDVTVCVSEYRNGQLLNILRRDFEITVAPCNTPLASFAAVGVYNGLPINQIECDSMTVHFANQSYDPSPPDTLSYHWDFGVAGVTNDTSNLANPVFTYPDTGKYLVRLVVFNRHNGQSCADSAAAWVFVYPVFSINFTPPFSCVDSQVTFSAQTISTCGNVNATIWTFGDGTTSNLSDVSHIYTATGTYIATLTEQNTVGCMATVTKNVFIWSCVNGLNELTHGVDITIYPNPANNRTAISYRLPEAKTALFKLYNPLGQIVLEQTLSGTDGHIALDVSQLATGVYQYRVVLDGRVVRFDKIVVIR